MDNKFCLIYKDVNGDTFWVDKDGNISKNIEIMTLSNANKAREAFIASCDKEVERAILLGNASVRVRHFPDGI